MIQSKQKKIFIAISILIISAIVLNALHYKVKKETKEQQEFISAINETSKSIREYAEEYKKETYDANQERIKREAKNYKLFFKFENYLDKKKFINDDKIKTVFYEFPQVSLAGIDARLFSYFKYTVIDFETLKDLYLTQNLTVKEIAKQLDYKASTIATYLSNNKISKRKSKNA